MLHTFEETVLTYRSEQLAAWRNGDKSLMPQHVEHRAIVDNQPSYHFGEAFVLSHFSALGWSGFMDYVLMPQVEPNIARHYHGRRQLELVADPAKLKAFRNERNKLEDGRRGYGEPDLFLYKPTGEIKFVEVKKQGDTLKDNQLICMAQLREFLGCEAEIVYLHEGGRRARTPRRYSICLDEGTEPSLSRVASASHTPVSLDLAKGVGQ
jgi:hypothetical protein